MSVERKRFEQAEERLRIYTRDHGICQACGKPVPMDGFEVAHRICSSVANYRRFGAEVIDHPLNKATTHPGRCNSAMNCGFKPNECERIVEAVKAARIEAAIDRLEEATDGD